MHRHYFFLPSADQRRIALVACAAAVLSCSLARAQFATVINVPPSPNIPTQSTLGSSTQLNLHPGGFIGDDFSIGSADGSVTDVEVNLLGGTTGGTFQVLKGALLNITNGSGNSFSIVSGGAAEISGDATFKQMRLSRSSLQIAGGVITGEVRADVLSNVHVTGGVIGDRRYSFHIWNRSSLAVSAGSLQSYVDLSRASIRVTGGRVDDVILMDDSNALMTGGEIGLLKIGSGAARIDGGVVGAVHNFDELDIFGGSISSYIWAPSVPSLPEPRLRIHGSKFAVNGVDVTSQIVLGEPLVISQRNVTLTGKYRDGTHFELPLSNLISPAAIVSLHLIPEPSGAALGMFTFVTALTTFRRRK